VAEHGQPVQPAAVGAGGGQHERAHDAQQQRVLAAHALVRQDHVHHALQVLLVLLAQALDDVSLRQGMTSAEGWRASEGFDWARGEQGF
jgi:hypothetical protein